MKWFIRLAALALALVAIASAIVWFFGGRIAREGVERAGTHALGVDTQLETLNIGLMSGRLELAGLSVANPEGFERDAFLSLGSGELEVSVGSLTSDLIEAQLLKLDGIDLSLEKRDGETNYGRILAHLQTLTGEGSSAPAEEGGKQFVLREVVITDVTAFVDLLPLGGELTQVTVKLPELRLKDVGSGGAPLSEIVAEIVQGLFEGVVEAGAGTIPGDILGELEANLAAFGSSVTDLASEVTGDLMQEGAELLDEGGQVIEDAADSIGEGLDDALKDAGSVLDGVLGGGGD